MRPAIEGPYESAKQQRRLAHKNEKRIAEEDECDAADGKHDDGEAKSDHSNYSAQNESQGVPHSSPPPVQIFGGNRQTEVGCASRSARHLVRSSAAVEISSPAGARPDLGHVVRLVASLESQHRQLWEIAVRLRLVAVVRERREERPGRQCCSLEGTNTSTRIPGLRRLLKLSEP
jgi:hypothetical protein